MAGKNFTKAGAKDIIAKPEPLLPHVEELFITALSNLLSPVGIHTGNAALERAVTALTRDTPESLPHWAEITSVSEVYLRKLWTGFYRIQPHFPLFLCHVLKKAFDHQLNHGPINEIEAENERIFFSTHKREMDWIVHRRYGARIERSFSQSPLSTEIRL